MIWPARCSALLGVELLPHFGHFGVAGDLSVTHLALRKLHLGRLRVAELMAGGIGVRKREKKLGGKILLALWQTLHRRDGFFEQFGHGQLYHVGALSSGNTIQSARR